MAGKTLIFTTNTVQSKLFKILDEKGFQVSAVEKLSKSCNKESVKKYDTLILPFPSKNESISYCTENALLSELLSPGQLVIGGMFTKETADEIIKAKCECADYFKNEAYVLKNAFITSQGALRLLLENTNDYLVGKKVLITGFGRIGKSLARMLKALGMKVFIAARSETAQAEAVVCGYEVFDFSQLYGTLFYYDYIFNTVPEKIFEDKHISRIRKDALYFELASSPFGADKADFDAINRSFISASSLPGRYFPLAVAENIADFMLSLRR